MGDRDVPPSVNDSIVSSMGDRDVPKIDVPSGNEYIVSSMGGRDAVPTPADAACERLHSR
jgi:hypothetical protein